MTTSNTRNETQSWGKRLLYSIIKTLKSIAIAFVIGIVLSFLIHIFADKALPTVIKFMGIAFAFAGLASHVGSDSINRDYNYNMAKISNPSIAKHENNLRTSGGSSSFMVVATASGGLLYALGYMLELQS